MLTARQLNKSFGTLRVLEDVSLDLAPGSITTVTTLPSGDTAGPASPGPGFAEQLAALASPKERA